MNLAVAFVALFHTLVFVVEAFLWMQPVVYTRALAKLGVTTSLDLHQQALVLQPLFVNQGFYNLLLAGAAAYGLLLARRGRSAEATLLMRYACLSALVAGIVLAVTTRAYLGAFLQATPGAVALLLSRHAISTAQLR